MNGKRLQIDILDSVANVVEKARFVSIDGSAIRDLADTLVDCPLECGTDEALLFRGSRDACANYVLLVDALNFCFWSPDPWTIEYRGQPWTRTFAMVAGLLRAIEKDRTWLSADRWAAATEADVDELFCGVGRIPLPERRLAVLCETGSILCERFGGSFVSFVESAGGDAERVAFQLSDCFPSFRDVAQYDGQEVAILKRAQLCAADLHRAWLANGFEGLSHLEALTVFADYRLPQLFRHERVLLLDDGLAKRIDRLETIEAGSVEEVEMRAATIWIGKRLCDVLSERGRVIAPWQLDYELWLRARAPGVLVPHHRTVTHYY